MIFAAALFALFVGSVSVKATTPDPNGAKIDRCILVNLKTMTEYILDTMTVTEYKFDEASPSGWSVKCFGETGKDIDFVKFFYDGDFVSEQYYSPQRFPGKPWMQPFWMNGDNNGDKVNPVPYLNSAGKKKFTVKFYTWEGGDTYPSDVKQYTLNGGASAPPSKCTGVVCPFNAVCDQATGACACNTGLVLTNGACVPPSKCTGVVCPFNAVCDQATGACACNAGLVLTNGACVPPSKCAGVVCPLNAVCDQATGACVCNAGLVLTNGACVPPSKCAGVVCPLNAVCDQATGACVCNAGLVLTNGACVPPSKCTGVVCPLSAVCNQATGACVCNAGLVLKNGACVPPPSGDDLYDGLCGWNEHYKKCRKHYGFGSGQGCYNHYRTHQCAGLSRRHLLKAVENTRALAEDHGACMADQYDMFLVMKGAHMTGLATPVNDASACPNLVFHSNVPIEGEMTKVVMIAEEEGVAAIAESEKLHLGTQSLLSIVSAFDNADVSKKGEKAYDAVTNNCVVLLRNMADPLDIPVDQRMINFVSKRLLAESGGHMVEMMKQSPALSAIVGTGGRFLKGVGAEEIVAKVISLYV